MRALALAATVVLLGCGGETLETELDAFHAQVAGLVGAIPETQPSVDHTLPSRRERRLSTSELSIGGFDFLSFQGCRLGALVGERNSPMGRQMVPSRRLVYELRFVEAARECVQRLSPARAERLSERLVTKERELASHVWNAIWLGEELEAYLSTGGSPLPTSRRDGGAGAVRSVAAQLAGDHPLRAEDGEAIEATLGELRHHPPVGPLLVRLDRVRATLDEVAALLASRDPTACGTEERALGRVFARAYPPLQSSIANLDRRVGEEIDALDALFEESARRLDRPPAAMQRYRETHFRPEGLWSEYRAAVGRHAAAWTPTLRICGGLPGES